MFSLQANKYLYDSDHLTAFYSKMYIKSYVFDSKMWRDLQGRYLLLLIHLFSVRLTKINCLILTFQVIIAQPKSTKSTEDYSDESALTRLFVVIPKGTDDKDLRKSFEEFGDIDYVQVVKDRRTGDPKGFGYVKFRKPHSAALAVENCEASFRAVMAEPKSAKLKREHQTLEPFTPQTQHGSRNGPLQDLGLNLGIGTTTARPPIDNNPFASVISSNSGFGSMSSGAPVSNRLYVIVSPRVTQDDLGRLFDLIPGMEFCDLKKNYTTGESKGYAYIVYNSVGSAIYAKEKLNGFNYPLGCKLAVQYASDDMGGGELPMTPKSTPVESSIDAPFLSSLPPAKPLEPDAECAERLFIVCHPNPLPDFMLRDVFSRFGGLIDVYLLRNKNFGYAKFATIDSAEKAIKTLHGHDVHGIKLKVLQADPPRESETARKRPRT